MHNLLECCMVQKQMFILLIHWFINMEDHYDYYNQQLVQPNEKVSNNSAIL